MGFTFRDWLFIGGALAAMVLAVLILQWWTRWRKRALAEAAEALGFRRTAPGETINVPLVPLINRPARSYLVILTGSLAGREAAFFDLYYTSGKEWNYQSTVLLREPKALVPKFQLRAKQLFAYTQRDCGAELAVPGHDEDMASLRLSCENPEWAPRVLSQAPPSYFQKVREGKWTIEGLGSVLVVYRWGTRVSPSKLADYLREAGALAEETFRLCA